MKIIAASDIHSNFDKFREDIDNIILGEGKVDLILLAGDLTNEGSSSELEELIKFIWSIEKYSLVLWITGNHDKGMHREVLGRNNINLTDTIAGVELKDDWFTVRGFNLTTCFDAPHLAQSYERMTPYRDFDLGYYSLAGYDDIILSHCPPSGLEMSKCKWKGGEVDIGSPGLRKYIEVNQPKLVVCGHVHEGAGMEEWIGKTKVVNVATMAKVISVDLGE